MARSFTTKNAKDLMTQHRVLLRRLSESAALPEKYTRDARRTVRDMNSYQAFDNMLRSEIIYEKPYKAHPDDLNRLLKSVYLYIRVRPTAVDCARLLKHNEDDINRKLNMLSAGRSAIGYFFASSARKQDADSAYNCLGELLNSEYASEAKEDFELIAKLESASAQDVTADFELNREAYRKAAEEMFGDVMGGSTGVREFTELIDRHDRLLRPIRDGEEKLAKSREAVSAAADGLRKEAAAEVLRSVSVEELNREKSGFRVKTLRDSGYETMADILGASRYQLEAVKGISAESAAEIKQTADSFAERSLRTAKVRLSADNRTPAATSLVSAVSRYRRLNENLKETREIQRTYGVLVNNARKELNDIGSGLRWLFYSDSEKDGAKKAYHTLRDMLKGEYADRVRSLSTAEVSPSVDPAQAWKDFEGNTVAYYNTLEEIVPELLGNDDSVYGLPEELAEQVKSESYDFTGLSCELRKYQEWGVKYILNRRRVLLGDEMGLGKTVQAIAVMVSLRNSGATRFAVVCPASVIANWKREIEKFSDLKPIKIHGADKLASLEEWKRDGGVAVTTFETTDDFELADDFRIDDLVVDEAHYIKNPKAKRTVNVRRLCAHAQRLLFMTGTALENRVDEMIELISILDPKLAGEVKGMAFMSSAPQFREKIAPVYYRRKRSDVLTELPELVESMEWLDLEREEENAYEMAVLGGNFAEARRVSWNIDDLSLSSKATRLKELCEEARQQERKVIVFSFFLDTIAKVRDLLGELCLEPINGSVSPQRRQEIVDEFNAAPAGAVLAAQIQAGGTGLNIQSASVVILCEPQLKPSIENQAISRAYRMGQSRNVLVYRLLCEDSVDERITELLGVKQNVFDAFADKSAAAENDGLDEKTTGQLMKEEMERVRGKVES